MKRTGSSVPILSISISAADAQRERRSLASGKNQEGDIIGPINCRSLSELAFLSTGGFIMMSGSVSFRLVRSLVIASLLVIFGVSPFSANDAKTGQALWEKKLPEEVLAILNADSNRVTLEAPGEEPVSLVNMSVVEFGQAPLQMLNSPSGVILLAARNKSLYVQLMAMDVDTGEKLWQIPCTGLPLSELPKEPDTRTGRIVSTFMTVRNQVIVLQRADDTSGGTASNILVSYDLRTGTELWRSQANQINYSDMLRQMSPELADKKGLTGWAMKKAMKDMNQMASPIAPVSTCIAAVTGRSLRATGPLVMGSLCVLSWSICLMRTASRNILWSQPRSSPRTAAIGHGMVCITSLRL
jgi:hypothetical protein